MLGKLNTFEIKAPRINGVQRHFHYGTIIGENPECSGQTFCMDVLRCEQSWNNSRGLFISLSRFYQLRTDYFRACAPRTLKPCTLCHRKSQSYDPFQLCSLLSGWHAHRSVGQYEEWERVHRCWERPVEGAV